MQQSDGTRGKAESREVIAPQGATAAAPSRRRHASWPDMLMVCFFLALFLVQIAHHNLWRDELNAFGIAEASPTLASLFQHIHYEGHPWLWYFLLWCVAQVTVSPVGMKVLEATIVVAIYLVLGLGSPFSRVERVLLFCNYFISFEYTVMSRMYSLLLLFAVLYARDRSLHPERAVRLGILLGLMASTDAMGMLLSAALFAEYVSSYFFYKTDERAVDKRQLAGGVLAYGLLGILAVASARTAPDISWRTTGHLFAYALNHSHFIDATISYVALPYFPAAFGRGVYSFWGVLPRQHRLLFVLWVPFVIFALYAIFRSKPNLLVLVGVGLCFSVLFGHLVYIGTTRHDGVNFLALLVALWLLRAACPRLPGMAFVLLIPMALAGVYAAYAEWKHPFSNVEPAVAWLVDHHMEGAPIVGTPDTSVASIAELLHRPVYMLDCSCSDSYLLFSKRRDLFKISQIPDRMVEAEKDLGTGQFIYVGVVPVTSEQERAIRQRGLTLNELARFAGADAEQEDFYLYQASPVR